MTYLPVPLPDRMSFSDTEMKARAVEFYEEIRRRHTVRDFINRPVPREIIETCLMAAGTAPNGANHQPWHFAVVQDPGLKSRIREAAEKEEREFYAGKAGEEWLTALGPIGTDANKPFLEIAPYLIVIFGQRKGIFEGRPRKNYYVPESVNIAAGFLIAALHHAGLATLTHTPNPMNFLNEVLGRPDTEKPYILLVVGHPTADAMVPAHAKAKKRLDEIASFQ
ncbi:MAG: Nitroreductase [Nevskia sp.]|nr:Nitroreductase [Nevskia sp.]